MCRGRLSFRWHTACIGYGPLVARAGEGREGEMAEGTIKTLRDDKGFGFIRPNDAGKDIFFHSSVVQGTLFDQLREGDQVTFTAGPDRRDPSRISAEVVRLAE